MRTIPLGLLAVLAAALVASVVTAGAGPAGAAFPGANGKIAFESRRDGKLDIYAMNPDGSGERLLTPSPPGYLRDDSREPAWSPDGSQIAFVRGTFVDVDIFVMNAGGGRATQLTHGPALDISPAWSPDGSRLAFQRMVFEGERTGPYSSDVYVMNADGSGQVNLTNTPEVYDGDPTWSPDGSKIAFSSRPVDNHEIYVMNTDGSEQVNLTNNPAYDCCPDWQPLAIGNVNCEDGINSIDADLVLRFDAGLIGLLVCDQNADVNGDGAINAIDAALILQFTAGLIDSLPP